MLKEILTPIFVTALFFFFLFLQPPRTALRDVMMQFSSMATLSHFFSQSKTQASFSPKLQASKFGYD